MRKIRIKKKRNGGFGKINKTIQNTRDICEERENEV